jgi:hypothetical protein
MSKELQKLEEIARIATKKALESYVVPDEYKDNLVLGTQFKEEKRIFELYLPGETPKDAIVISSAEVDRKTRKVTVQITNLNPKSVPQ